MIMAAAQGATDGAASLVQSVDWLALAPPALTAAVALIVLVADLFLPGRRKPLLGAVSVAGLAAALLLLLPLRSGDRSTFCLTADPGVCSYTADHFTLAIQLLVLGGALLTALLSVTEVGEAGETGVAAGTAATGAAEAETRAGAGARADAGARAGGTSGTTKLPRASSGSCCSPRPPEPPSCPPPATSPPSSSPLRSPPSPPSPSSASNAATASPPRPP